MLIKYSISYILFLSIYIHRRKDFIFSYRSDIYFFSSIYFTLFINVTPSRSIYIMDSHPHHLSRWFELVENDFVESLQNTWAPIHLSSCVVTKSIINRFHRHSDLCWHDISFVATEKIEINTHHFSELQLLLMCCETFVYQ